MSTYDDVVLIKATNQLIENEDEVVIEIGDGERKISLLVSSNLREKEYYEVKIKSLEKTMAQYYYEKGGVLPSTIDVDNSDIGGNSTDSKDIASDSAPEQTGSSLEISDDGFWIVDGQKTNLKAVVTDEDNPQGLRFKHMYGEYYSVYAPDDKKLKEIVIPAIYNGNKG